ncbi:peptidoglycan-binding protein [Streptomyces sp. NPDC002790]|uniref:peptidoglycan-binding domain-containing protein n=1 Tax=Streptomyces sp. NPDC002790 TaxID=3154431 RepID=UPI00331900C6
MYPALSSYLAQTPGLGHHRTAGSSRPEAGPTCSVPSATAPARPRKTGKRRRRKGEPDERCPHAGAPGRGGPARRVPLPRSGYGIAAVLALATASFLAPTHTSTPSRPHTAAPHQPDVSSLPHPPASAHASPPSSADKPAHQSAPPANPGTSNPHTSPEPEDGDQDVLTVGSTGSAVVRMQGQLRQLRLYTGPMDGHYSHDVAAAVARMQQAQAIPEPLGRYGPATRAAITTAVT